VVDTDGGQITHLILREGHLWGQRDVAIPLVLIDRMEENVVQLNVNKKSVGELPTLTVQREW
jgi:hypothetical protein